MLFYLRTPTVTVDGFSEILADGRDGPLNPKQTSSLDRIRSGSLQLHLLLDVFIDVLNFDDNWWERVSGEGTPIDNLPQIVDEALSERHSFGSLRIDPKIDISFEITEKLPRITAEKEWLIRIIRLMVISAASALYHCSRISVRTEVDGAWLDIFVIANQNVIRYKFDDLKARYPFLNIYDSIDLEFKEYYKKNEDNPKGDFYPIMFAVIHGLSKLHGAEFRTDVSEANSTMILRLPVDGQYV